MSDDTSNRLHGRTQQYWTHAAKTVENRTPVTMEDLVEAYDLLYQPGRIPPPSEVGEEAIDVQHRRAHDVGRDSQGPNPLGRWGLSASARTAQAYLKDTLHTLNPTSGCIRGSSCHSGDPRTAHIVWILLKQI